MWPLTKNVYNQNGRMRLDDQISSGYSYAKLRTIEEKGLGVSRRDRVRNYDIRNIL